MTRDEWLALPPAIALAALYDLIPGLATAPAPSVPRKPKYDSRLSKKGGYVWMSEMTAEDLKWWRGKKQESVDGGGQYAEKDAKTLRAIDGFLAWREVFPHDVWWGIRGDGRVTARPPSRDPIVHEWDNSGGQRRGGTVGGSRAAPAADDYGDVNEDDIPF